MSRVKTYSPKDVVIAWGGVAITGVAEDTFITVTRNSDNSDTVVGAQGVVAHTKIADQTGMIELTLLQNAEANVVLTDIQLAQDGASDMFFWNMTITDPSGGMLWDARDAHLRRASDVTLGSGQNAKTYTFFVDELVAVGANSEIANALGIASRVNAAAGVIKSVIG
jgi:hypothetical protein